MICKACGKEAVKITFVMINGILTEGCRDCISLTPVVNYRVVDDTMGFRIGVGHKKDIRRRKFDYHTQKVYRDYGRKYFDMSRT